MRFPYPRRRRLSQRPENVRRRLSNRFFKALAALVIAGAYALWNHFSAPAPATPGAPVAATATATAAAPQAATEDIDALIAARRDNVQVTVTATVARILKDDNDGSRHQRFSFDTPAGHRVQVAHNIDLAPRIEGLKKGDRVTVYGELEWHAKGSVIHWTHRDPAGRHADGWIEFQGRKYQ